MPKRGASSFRSMGYTMGPFARSAKCAGRRVRPIDERLKFIARRLDGEQMALNRKGGGETAQREVAVQLDKARRDRRQWEKAGAVAAQPSAARPILVWSHPCRGTRRQPRPAEGRRWTARAAEVGILDAQVALGEMMLTGTAGVCDPSGALVLFEKAASRGSSGRHVCSRRPL